MVLHKYGDKLYNGLKDAVDEHLEEVAAKVEASNEENFLHVLNEAWSDHKMSMFMIRDILMYMVCGWAPYFNGFLPPNSMTSPVSLLLFLTPSSPASNRIECMLRITMYTLFTISVCFSSRRTSRPTTR